MDRKTKRIIWDGIDFDPEKFAKELKEDQKEMYPDVDDQFWLDYAVETHELYLDDERSNLDVDVDGELVIFADLGLWNGRRFAFKKVGRSKNVSDILSHQCNNSEMAWWCDRYNVCADEVHHDGTNHYVYRQMKDGRSAEFLEGIFHSRTINEKTWKYYMNRYTLSIADAVKHVYGW